MPTLNALHVIILALLTCSISAASSVAPTSFNCLSCGVSGSPKFRDFDALSLLQLHGSVERRHGFSNLADFDADSSESSTGWGYSRKCWESHGKHLLYSNNGTIVPFVAPIISGLLEVRRPPERSCLGDICIQPPRLSLAALKATDRREIKLADYKMSRASLKRVQVACPKKLAEDRRVVLVPVVPSYHSSTALEQVLMSSPSLATLCAVGTWQCEGQWIRDELGEKRNRLHPYSLVWDLKRPVFFDKLPGYGGAQLDHYYVEPWLHEPIPETMYEIGIHQVDLAYLLMWRPVCLAQMSTHAVEQILANGVHDYALRELLFLENTTLSYQKLLDRNLPVMVVNLGDMLWAPELSQMRLEGFLPCLGKLDFDFVPQVGKDISSCNMWKADGSVKAFGDSVDPKERYGYDVTTGACDGRYDLFEVLGADGRERAKFVLSELTRMSRLSPWTGTSLEYGRFQ